MATGITRRHSRNCPALSDGRCKCHAGWEASIYSARDGKKIRKRFVREGEARSWRAAAKSGVDLGTLRAPTAATLNDVGMRWLEGAEAGEVASKSGRPFKPKTLRGYRRDLTEKILPLFGSWKLSAIEAPDLQAMIDQWQSEGHAPSTIRNGIKPLQAIYRRAQHREGVINPTLNLELPTPNSEEVCIPALAVAAKLVETTPVEDRAIWGSALYAGLRYGELQAQCRSDVDLAAGLIHVRRSWDQKTGTIEPKTRASRRAVPIPPELRDILAAHFARRGKLAADDLVFGQGPDQPFEGAWLYRRADRAWAAESARQDLERFAGTEEAELVGLLYEMGHRLSAIARAMGVDERTLRRHVKGQAKPTHSKTTEGLRLHLARHTYASMLIAANINAKLIQTYMGHSSIRVTYDKYGHLFPGSAAETAAALGTYLEAQRVAAEEASVRPDGFDPNEIDSFG